MLVTLSEGGVRGCVVPFLRSALRLVSPVIIFVCVFGCVDMFLSLCGCCLCYPFARFGIRSHCAFFGSFLRREGWCSAEFLLCGEPIGAAMRCVRGCFCLPSRRGGGRRAAYQPLWCFGKEWTLEVGSSLGVVFCTYQLVSYIPQYPVGGGLAKDRVFWSYCGFWEL